MNTLPIFVVGYLVLGLSKVEVGLIIAALTLTIGSNFPLEIFRITRNNISTEKRAKYVDAALAKGLKIRLFPLKGSVTWHVFRNVIITVMPFINSRIPQSIGGSLVIELVYDMRGIGSVILESLTKQDIPAVLSGILIIIIIVRIIVISTELMFALLNPKIIYDQS